MKISLEYSSGLWQEHKDMVLRLPPEQESKLAQLIEGTVSRYQKRLEAEAPQEEPKEETQEEEPEQAPTPVSDPVTTHADVYQPKGYKGMLRITCPKCKDTFYRYTWKRVNEVTCNCGEHIELGVMVPAEFYCPNCSKHYNQYTNSTSATIYSNCGSCKCEMTATWNAKKNRYDPAEE